MPASPQNVFDRRLVELASELRKFLRGRVRSAALADDLTQETLLKAFLARESLRDGARVRAWLYRIARGVIVDHHRKARVREWVPLIEPPAARDDSRQRLVSESVERSAKCYLNTLPPKYREPVWLAEYEGLSHAEVAQRQGISLTAVKSRIRRGKQRVRELMEGCCRMVYDCRGKVVDYELWATIRASASVKATGCAALRK